MSTELSVPEIPSDSPSKNNVVLTRQEFDSLCQRAKFVNRIISRFCATLQTIRQRVKRKPQSHKRLARKLRRLSLNR